MTRAALLAVVAIALLTVMDATAKLLSERFNILQLTFLRFAFGSIGATAALAWARPAFPSRETIRINLIRALLIVATSTLFFYSVSVLPLAEVMVLAFVSPLFMALLGFLLLREPVGPRVKLALAIGFSGMLFIAGQRIGASGYGEQAVYGVVAVIVSAIGYALVMVLLRARATQDAIEVIVFIQNIVPAVVLSVPAAYFWVAPTPREWGIYASMGVLGIIGHLLIANAFARAEAAKLAPIEYTGLFWGVLLGYWWFGEWPTLTTLAGAVLIVAATYIAGRK